VVAGEVTRDDRLANDWARGYVIRRCAGTK
jgi:hypothetical protein